MRKKVIVDCDNTMGLPGGEIDDGLALLYLLGRDDIEIVGVTNTFGNGSVRDVERCTSELLREIGRTDIRRVTGEAYDRQNPILVSDGDGSDRYDNELPPPVFPSDAARFLVETVNACPNGISILVLGPVGNIYDAGRLDSDFYDNVAEIVLMGGYTKELELATGPCRELNLSCNPRAAHSVLHASSPVVVFNGHICLQAPFEERDFRRVQMWPTSRINLIRNWFATFTERYKERGFYLWDLLPAVYLSFPGLFDLRDVAIAPTIDGLHHGWLMPTSDDDVATATIAMPENIVDSSMFMEVVEEGWRREWSLEAGGWKSTIGGCE